MIRTIAIVGCGSRGYCNYGRFINSIPDKAKVVAIADINPDQLAEAKEELKIADNMCFGSADELLAQPKLADAVIISTLDQDHVPQALVALEKGYDILMEKPISGDKKECQQILEAANKYGRKVVVCHVLRYAPHYRKIKELLDSKVIGELMTVQSVENVAYWHYAHSFVRGNWRRSEDTTPMIMAKSCHDMDLMVWLTGKKCISVSSFGELSHFKKECAPEGATAYCVEGCKAKETCPYNAEQLYIYDEKRGVAHGNTNWPVRMVNQFPTVENVKESLKTSPYGRCVYHCDNNVVDHQVVNLQMEDGVTVNFTMTAFSHEITRFTKFMGTHGQIIADLDANKIELCVFGKEPEIIEYAILEGHVGHGGGDNVLVLDFLAYLNGEKRDGITSLEDSLESHFICMAAEESRVNKGKLMEMKDFRS